MEIRNYLTVLWRRKWLIVLTMLTCVLVAAVGTYFTTPMYEASVTLWVPTAREGSSETIYYDVNYADRLMNTYVKIATSGPLEGELAQRLGITALPTIKVEISPNTELMRIAVRDADPALAAKAANTLAELLIAKVKEADTVSGKSAEDLLGAQLAQIESELAQAQNDYQTTVAQNPQDAEKIAAASEALRVKQNTYGSLLLMYERTRASQKLSTRTIAVIEPAVVPLDPVSPSKLLNLALGMMVGLLGGVGVAFVAENFDTRLHSVEQIEQASRLPVLGNIPKFPTKPEGGALSAFSPAGEAFRLVRTSLMQSGGDALPRTILITSAEPREGKSTLGAHLADTIAQAGYRTLIMDCDLRIPTLHKVFDLKNDRGVSSVLDGMCTAEEATQTTKSAGAAVLTSGPLPPNPAELLGSPEMGRLLAEVASKYDVVLLDSPAMLAVTDAVILAAKVDGVILVVARGQARLRTVQRARELLSKAKVLGVIVNHAELNGTYYHYGEKRSKRSGEVQPAMASIK